MQSAFFRFLFVVHVTTFSTLAFVAGISHFVDPYGLGSVRPVPGLNVKKSASQRFVVDAKTARGQRVRPQTLLMGNSRVDGGLDPADPFWPKSLRPVFNDGLPSQSFTTSVAEYRAISSVSKINTIVAAIDFLDFVPNCTPKPANFEGVATRFAPPLFLKTHLSLAAVADVVSTIRAQRDPFSVDMREDGFNPWMEIEKYYRAEGVSMVVRQKNEANIHRFRFMNKSLKCADGSVAKDWGALSDLLSDAHKSGINVILFIPPYHADILESFRIAGLWGPFEDFKRELVRAVERSPALHSNVAGVFDFAVYDPLTTEDIPMDGDLTTRLNYYYEPGHFKPSLGHLLTRRIVEGPSSDTLGFGAFISSGNVSAQLNHVEQRRVSYALSRPQAVARVEKIWRGSASR